MTDDPKLIAALARANEYLQLLYAVAYGPPDITVHIRMYLDGEVDQVPLDPNLGGCWFCSMSGANLFCKGWDAFYHQECLEEERRESPDNPELSEFE